MRRSIGSPARICRTTRSIPSPAKFIAPACVIDCSEEAAANPDFVLTVAVRRGVGGAHGTIAPGSWVLLRTDWSKKSSPTTPACATTARIRRAPSPEVVKFLVEERDVHGFGTETIGTDAGQAHHFTPPYPAHFYMHGKGRYGLQCLTNLDLLPPKGAVIVPRR